MHFYHESLIGMTDKFSHYFGVFVFVFSLTNVVRTVQAFSLYLGPKLYFNLNQISTYFVNKFLARAKRTQRSTMRKNASKKFWFWRQYVRTSTPSCKPDWNFAFQVPTGSAVNRIATTTRPILSSDLNFNVYIDVEKELEQEIKNKGDQFRRKNNMEIL